MYNQRKCDYTFIQADSLTLLQPISFMIWPAAILKFNHRYIVAIRNLKNNKGQPIKPSTAFRALRDNILTDDPDIG